jgi:hypothetical protein
VPPPFNINTQICNYVSAFTNNSAADHQYLFTREELQAAGLLPGELSSLAVQLASNSGPILASGYSNLTIYLANVG